MITFHPLVDFEQIAQVLDYRRLGKQRPEAMQILNATQNPNNGWRHLPIVRMWKPYPNALKLYFNTISHEWERRGYQHNMGYYDVIGEVVMPSWIGNEDLHSSHRSALLAKDYKWYSQFGWVEEPKIDYWWPSHKARLPLVTERRNANGDR